MSGKSIATIYFYLISAGSIVLIVIGIFNIVNLFINLTQYEKYPLRYSGVSSCDYSVDGSIYNVRGPAPVKLAPPLEGENSTPSAEEVQRARKQCLENEEADRKQHLTDDIKNSITFALVGIVLFLIHFPQARKHSQG